MQQLPSLSKFVHIQKQIKQMNQQLVEKDRSIAQRKQQFQKCLNTYASYIDKQDKLLKKNIIHTQQRNKWMQNQIKKSWIIAIANRPMTLRTIARTNIMKRDAQQWINGFDSEIFANSQNDLSQNMENQSHLLIKYNDIKEQYKFKF